MIERHDLRVLLSETPLDPGQALAFVSTDDTGAQGLFCGTVRSPNDGEVVDHLEYEAWAGRAEEVLGSIATEAAERFGARRVYVAHRTGEVQVGEASVVVAVSTPHRAEAFEACRFVIDTLKENAPIWKKEFTQEGQRWVGMPS